MDLQLKKYQSEQQKQKQCKQQDYVQKLQMRKKLKENQIKNMRKSKIGEAQNLLSSTNSSRLEQQNLKNEYDNIKVQFNQKINQCSNLKYELKQLTKQKNKYNELYLDLTQELKILKNKLELKQIEIHESKIKQRQINQNKKNILEDFNDLQTSYRNLEREHKFSLQKSKNLQNQLTQLKNKIESIPIDSQNKQEKQNLDIILKKIYKKFQSKNYSIKVVLRKVEEKLKKIYSQQTGTNYQEEPPLILIDETFFVKLGLNEDSIQNIEKNKNRSIIKIKMEDMIKQIYERGLQNNIKLNKIYKELKRIIEKIKRTYKEQTNSQDNQLSNYKVRVNDIIKSKQQVISKLEQKLIQNLSVYNSLKNNNQIKINGLQAHISQSNILISLLKQTIGNLNSELQFYKNKVIQLQKQNQNLQKYSKPNPQLIEKPSIHQNSISGQQDQLKLKQENDQLKINIQQYQNNINILQKSLLTLQLQFQNIKSYNQNLKQIIFTLQQRVKILQCNLLEKNEVIDLKQQFKEDTFEYISKIGPQQYIKKIYKKHEEKGLEISNIPIVLGRIINSIHQQKIKK